MLVDTLITSSQDILFLVTAAAIAILTIMVSLVCFQLIQFLSRLRTIATNIEETTETINSMIKPANFATQILRKVVVLAHDFFPKQKKKRTKKNDE